jgi:hypothetical protein
MGRETGRLNFTLIVCRDPEARIRERLRAGLNCGVTRTKTLYQACSASHILEACVQEFIYRVIKLERLSSPLVLHYGCQIYKLVIALVFMTFIVAFGRNSFCGPHNLRDPHSLSNAHGHGSSIDRKDQASSHDRHGRRRNRTRLDRDLGRIASEPYQYNASRCRSPESSADRFISPSFWRWKSISLTGVRTQCVM